MSPQLTQKLGIWGNEKCMQCGACCYDYNKNSLCRYQSIRDGKSYCKMHESPKRDRLCQNWFCVNLAESSKAEFRHIATNILRTTPCTFSTPQ